MNLVQGIQEQIERNQEILKLYEAIGPAGAFGALMIRNAIQKGKDALGSGDVVEMLAAYKDLERTKE
jgi:hypothetical protein